jgi:hypothetical protein
LAQLCPSLFESFIVNINTKNSLHFNLAVSSSHPLPKGYHHCLAQPPLKVGCFGNSYDVAWLGRQLGDHQQKAVVRVELGVSRFSGAIRSAKGGKGLPADHFEEALYKKSAKGLPQAIQVCQTKIPLT